MKRTLLSALGFVLGAVLTMNLLSVQAQTPITNTAALTSATCPGSGCLTVATTGWGSLSIQVNGTFTGTLTFQGSIDGVTYNSIQALPSTSTTYVTTTTGTGLWTAPVGGFAFVRVNMTSYTSGTATVFVQPASAGGIARVGSSGTSSGCAMVYTAKTANYNAVAGDLVSTGTAGAITVTLPAASTNANKCIGVVNNGAGTTTVGHSGSDTVALGSTDTLNPGSSSSVQGDSGFYWADGISNWNKM